MFKKLFSGLLISVFLLGGVAYPYTAYAALTVGTATTSSSQTFSHTVASGTELVAVGILSRRSTGGVSVVSVTFNGIEVFTKGGGGNLNGAQTNDEIWYLVNPTATTANIVVVLAGAVDGDEFWAVNISGGVDTSSPIGTVYTNNNGNNPGDQSRSVTPVAQGGVFLSNILGTGGTFTAGTVTVSRSNVDVALGVWFGAGGYKAHTGGATTVSWSWNGDDGPQHVIVEIKEVSTAVPTPILALIRSFWIW